MRFLLCGLTALCAGGVFANDSTGYVGTGGVEYIKNDKISMHSEDLFISKKIIRVDYQFKNETKQDITENILFPLPKVESYFYSDFADASKLIQSFKVQVNGQTIHPQTHVRAFLTDIKTDDENRGENFVDVTANFKACGLTDQELMNPWRQNLQSSRISQKILQCKDAKIADLIQNNLTDDDDAVRWHSQIIYSWQQTFKANALTRVQHQYQPLVGGSIGFSMSDDGEAKTYCMDEKLKTTLRKNKAENSSYQALSYILTTGANWAKPIQDFKLTIEREPYEFVSLCWAGKIKKISATRFEMREKNFRPQQDLDIMFINPQRRYVD